MLTEEWLERLMDRMEKEYTHALQVGGRWRGSGGWGVVGGTRVLCYGVLCS